MRDVLGADYQIAHQGVGLLGDGNHGASIASRWPVAAAHDVDLRLPSRTLDYPCGTLIAEVQAPPPFGPLLFVCHGPWYPWWAEYEREQQALAAARAIEAHVTQPAQHVVVAGHSNAAPDRASMRFWTGRQSMESLSVCYADAWALSHPDEAGETFTPHNPLTGIDETGLQRGRRIDYVLVRCGQHGPSLDVSRCELLFDEAIDGVWASDHFGVVADLVVPARPAEPS